LDNLDARSNPQIIQVALAHIQEHIMNAQTMDPTLAQILGYPVLQAPQVPMQPGAEVSPDQLSAGPGTELPQPEDVNMPQMPTDPLTGEQAPMPPESVPAAL
jgi:hypothetical protein